VTHFPAKKFTLALHDILRFCDWFDILIFMASTYYCILYCTTTVE
jgi:hypothetical protein